ncbi:unnamed protein product [Euphydryas editha]|uniref:DNA helicase n=1 Tax=Euphydryas editha TaxID=104508 RepID=A0AAU9V935_EUPED|nr:unnamed protein product [Euphydryas editha]
MEHNRSGKYIAAYSGARGFVGMVKTTRREDTPQTFLTFAGDPIMLGAHYSLDSSKRFQRGHEIQPYNGRRSPHEPFWIRTNDSEPVGGKQIILIGDVTQFTYIARENLFEIMYCRPYLTNITKELSCTYRSPMNVAYAISEIYKNTYSSNFIAQSLSRDRYAGAQISMTERETLCLVYTHKKKKLLLDQICGIGEGSLVMTIQEAQEQIDGEEIIVQSKTERLEYTTACLMR